jgi:hypothetical protein
VAHPASIVGMGEMESPGQSWRSAPVDLTPHGSVVEPQGATVSIAAMVEYLVTICGPVAQPAESQ